MLSIVLALAVATRKPRVDPVIGTWLNRRETVAIVTSRCGAELCGRVVWAAPEAQQATAEGGTQRLVGTTLMRNFRRVGAGVWAGEVVVPDFGQTAQAEMTLLGADEIEINGCQFGGLLCKRQVWHKRRVPTELFASTTYTSRRSGWGAAGR